MWTWEVKSFFYTNLRFNFFCRKIWKATQKTVSSQKPPDKKPTTLNPQVGFTKKKKLGLNIALDYLNFYTCKGHLRKHFCKFYVNFFEKSISFTDQKLIFTIFFLYFFTIFDCFLNTKIGDSFPIGMHLERLSTLKIFLQTEHINYTLHEKVMFSI